MNVMAITKRRFVARIEPLALRTRHRPERPREAHFCDGQQLRAAAASLMCRKYPRAMVARGTGTGDDNAHPIRNEKCREPG